MKKLFHPGVVALIVITISSCSKSGNDLVMNSKNENHQAFPKGVSSTMTNAGTNAGQNNVWGDSKIYEFINEPYQLQLGDPNNSIIYGSSGVYAVFYVIVSDEYVDYPAKLGTLTATDDVTMGVIKTCEMISGENAAAYNITVPEELNGMRFFFGIVTLNDLAGHEGNTITLYSEILNEKATLSAQLDHAFMFMP